MFLSGTAPFHSRLADQKRKELQGVDPSLLERALHAFALLGRLAESELTFVFKGGTSLLLHLPSNYFSKLVNTDDIWEVRVQFGGDIFSNN